MPRKTQNQTIFVAALSVYIGLLIVGAPPQNLAQTAKSVCNKSDAQDLTNQDFYANVENELLTLLLKNSINKFAEDFCQSALVQTDWRGTFKLFIKTDNAKLTVKIQPRKHGLSQNADFAAPQSQFFEPGKCVRQRESNGIFYKNKQILGKKSNFQIVAHLPRAALESLVQSRRREGKLSWAFA
jgi:hypothetical protein